MDIRPPRNQPRPAPRVSLDSSLGLEPASVVTAEPVKTPEALLVEQEVVPEQPAQPKRKHSKVKWLILSVIALLVLAAAGVVGWYTWAINPVAAGDTSKHTFTVTSGETPSIIAKNLQQAHLVRSALAFEAYTKLHKLGGILQAGVYEVSPSQSVASIATQLTKGKSAVLNVLIPPGLTLKQLADPSVKSSFAAQGFSSEEIQAAFAASYSSPLLKDKPADASLEGYIYPETFQIQEGDSLKSVLQRSFDTFYERLQSDGMLEKFAARGLNIHQALTLGSIIQEETSSADVQRQVAQVFLKRLEIGMMLGSDVTFIYAANQLGVEATPELDSPYNTRIHTGLPPGPIATMNYSALQALADPAEGDYLFFVAGDDGTVHFSRTNEEHEQQVQQYCQKLCTSTVQ